MENLTTAWQAQDKKRLAILAGATLVAFLAVFFLTRLATAPRMELLFARLEPAAASEVVASLDARGVAYDIQGDSIYVDGAMRDALRMQLAGEGLPRMDGTGYEVLDGLSGFGTTSQMFDAAYWRAREGELTRTILASPGVKLARVHLATADSSPFSRDRSATASVTVQMTSGAVGSSLARAVQSLVAGAVQNLVPEDVTVIDAASGRVVGGGAVDTEEDQRATRVAEMRASVENLLAARVGEGRYVVELAVETRKDVERITERVLDPDSRVVLSTDTEERTASDRGGAGVGVTVASNLPEGDAADGGEGSQSNNAETRERVNYDFSATERQIERGPGAIERLTVAVMVDGQAAVAEDGTTEWAPRDAAELDMIRELVQSAVGFREERGDEVTVRSMEFDVPANADAAPGLSLPFMTGGQVTQLVTAGLLAAVALGLLAFVVRPVLARVMTPQLPAPVRNGEVLETDPGGADPLAAPQELPAPDRATADRMVTAKPDAAAAMADLSDLSNLGAFGATEGADGDPQDPVDRLRSLIADRREETVEVLRGWMDETPTESQQ
ncbi:flagellar basal-body MS-ring/collar protein FliF [Jannaschia donghaensis]|uniref:Flagellar M-ring protein n=1 Tax=Jannaschia donghaensis TaxID=420998 RepID=A0A0M6YJ45_9RHOB|nr:flagellar basal-body MS-ring/collar protein FliF [Jannaschia donghaensis]CTQ49086.1 Flagellar M-ring protein [Jannaschia donghaensis]